VLSAIYLLWAYQRVALGEITVEKNRTLPDASGRERLILATMAVAIIVMGVASPFFTRRMEASVKNVMEQVEPPRDASRPMLGSPPAPVTRKEVVLPGLQVHSVLAAIAERHVQQ
jgi:hypothetical protein